MTPRGRLYRKYVVVLLVLVGGVLMASSLVELYFAYRETQRAIVRVERAKAVAAANRIEQFLKDVEVQVRETTRTASDDPDASQTGPAKLGFREGLGAALAEQRELDFLRVLRNVSAVGQLSHLDLAGKEQLRVSRLDPDVVGSQADFSRDPKFVEPRAGKTYWSPVYFKNDAEPWVTLAVPVGKYAVEVTTAEVSLGPVQKIVSQIDVGADGYAYVVDSRDRLVAHPDSRMLRAKRELAGLVQVKAARAGGSGSTVENQPAMVADGLGGARVLAAHAPIAPLGWLVFVERPAADAYAPLRAPIVRSIVIFVLGLVLSVLASVLLARRMVAPIRTLQEGAARIGAGDLGHRIEVRTGDELEALGDELNRTASQLEESYANLEGKVEERTRELAEANAGLTEALEQQTATSEMLRVISSSPTDIQPVLDAMAQNAVRLCDSFDSIIYRVDGDLLRLASHHGPILFGPIGTFTISMDRESVAGRSIIERRTIHVADLQTETQEFPRGATIAREFGYHTTLLVPLLREGVGVGAIGIRRTEVRPFTDKQVTLLQIFADQAVIAIENVRLFKELQARTADLTRSVAELQALGEVSQALGSTLDLDTILRTIVARANHLARADACTVYEYDEASEALLLRATDNLAEDVVAVARRSPIRRGEGVAGRMAVTHEPIQVADIAEPGAYQGPLRDVLLRTGTRAILGIPLLHEGQLVGALTVNKKEPGPFSPEVIDLLKTFAAQSALAIQNARLFLEIEDKSRQLEVASQHKSEFLANMSHELRTPLNAIIGFSEVLAEGMFGEINDKQAEYLHDILESGRHLLSLINDILDLSKIEAGRMELDATDINLPELIDNALILVRERAARREIALGRELDDRLGRLRADERKVKQVLLNLLSNALKFTPEGGRVGIRGVINEGMAEISVTDTGVGIAPEDQEVVFEEFRQVGSASGKVEGTGLGLPLSRKFIELHGGRLWVKSEPGRGSTFTFTLPLADPAERGARSGEGDRPGVHQ